MSLHKLLSYATIATVDGVMLFLLSKNLHEIFFGDFFCSAETFKGQQRRPSFGVRRKIERPFDTRRVTATMPAALDCT